MMIEGRTVTQSNKRSEALADAVNAYERNTPHWDANGSPVP